jgi:transposase
MSHQRPMDAYSEDLRKKIVQALAEQRMTKSEAARTFGVSLSSVKRYAKAVREGRSLSPGKAPGKRPLLDEKAKRLLEADVQERPFAKLADRREYLLRIATRLRREWLDPPSAPLPGAVGDRERFPLSS